LPETLQLNIERGQMLCECIQSNQWTAREKGILMTVKHSVQPKYVSL